MKFSDGQWLTKKGVIIQNPIEVHDVIVEDKSVTIFAPFRNVVSRASSIDGGLLTITFSTPMENIIKVKITHHKGQKKRFPEFILNEKNNNKVIIENTEKKVMLKSGDLSVQVKKGEAWTVDFFDKDKKLTRSAFKSMGYIEDAGNGVFMKDQLDLQVGECVYGLGERFSGFVKNGQTVDIWNEDGGTDSEQTYKNIPFYLTNKGYGVFINHTEKVSLEIASESVTKTQFSVPGETLEYYIINGPDPKKIIENYTALTGRPALPPAWSFGLWLSTSFTTSYDEKTVTGFIDGMAERDIPLSVFHFDCFWMKEYHLSNLKWDDKVYPEPDKFLERLKEKGLKICVWINPYISQRSEMFDEGAEKGYFIKTVNGDVWQWDRWQAGTAIVDFTNPDAAKWFTDKLQKIIDTGVDCFKTDFGERIPADGVYYDGSDPKKMHNYYPYLYNKAVFELLEKNKGKGNAVVFARSATTGCQKFPVHWGGDCWANYESMAESLRGGLSLGMAGFGYWSHDIGGFEKTATPDLYKRWAAFGLLSSHSRLHGSSSYRVPWLFDDEASDVLSFFTKLKCSLMPYIFSKAIEASEKGIPVMRAMILEFPDDPGCDYLDRQYMLGDSLLVAPVFSEDGIVSYYLPPGKWVNYFTGEVVTGSKWIKEKHSYLSLPLFIRENSIVPIGNNNNTAVYDYSEGVTYLISSLSDKCNISINVYNQEGKSGNTITLEKNGKSILIKVSDPNKTSKFLIKDKVSIKSISGGVFTSDKEGILVTLDKNTMKINIELN